MKEDTRKAVKNLIKVNNITDPKDERIETCIADRFPEEYKDEQSYISFQVEIADIVKKMEKTMKRGYTMYEGLVTWYDKDEYKDLMQSMDEQGKGDIIDVPATKTNILDAVGQIISCNYGVDPDKLSKDELLVLAKKLGYLFD